MEFAKYLHAVIGPPQTNKSPHIIHLYPSDTALHLDWREVAAPCYTRLVDLVSVAWLVAICHDMQVIDYRDKCQDLHISYWRTGYPNTGHRGYCDQAGGSSKWRHRPYTLLRWGLQSPFLSPLSGKFQLLQTFILPVSKQVHIGMNYPLTLPNVPIGSVQTINYVIFISFAPFCYWWCKLH